MRDTEVGENEGEVRNMLGKCRLWLIALLFVVAAQGLQAAQDLPAVPSNYTVTILAEGLKGPAGFFVDSEGILFVSAWFSGGVYQVAGDGTTELLAGDLPEAFQPAMSPDGRLFTTVGGSDDAARIWEIVAGKPDVFYSGPGAAGIEWHDDGFLYFTQSPTGSVLRSDLAGNASVFASGLGSGITGLAFGPDEHLYVANNDTNIIFRIDPAGTAKPFLSNLPRPEMLAFDSEGNLYFSAFTFNTIYKIDASKDVSPFARGGPKMQLRDLNFDLSGDLFVSDYDLGKIYRISKLPTFIRGDANVDRLLDIADPVTILNFSFLGTGSLGCDDSADANDDGKIDIADAIGLFSYLFLGTFPPPPPFPSCGDDETPDAFICVRSTGCN